MYVCAGEFQYVFLSVLVKRHLMWPKDCPNTQVCISKNSLNSQKCSWHAHFTDDSSIGHLCEVASANIPELLSAFKWPKTLHVYHVEHILLCHKKHS